MSDVQNICRQAYVDFIDRQTNINSDLKRALRTHERVPAFIDNLAREFSSMQWKATKHEITKAVEDLTTWFIRAATQSRDEAMLSHISQQSIRDKGAAQREFEKEVEIFDQKGADHVFKTEKGEIAQTITPIKPEDIKGF